MSTYYTFEGSFKYRTNECKLPYMISLQYIDSKFCKGMHITTRRVI